MPTGIYKRKPSQGFQKGHKINNGRIRSTQTKEKISQNHADFNGEKSGMWKGDNAGRNAIHKWLTKEFGKPSVCEDCGKIGKNNKGNWTVHWSNVDHKYRRVREDYKGRCPKCHKKYDKMMKYRVSEIQSI